MRAKFAPAVPYLCLLIPTSFGIWVHLNFVPMLLRGWAFQFKESALPAATQWALAADAWLWSFPVVVLFFAFASTRSRLCRSAIVPALLGSLFAIVYLLYGMCLTLPSITLIDQLGR